MSGHADVFNGDFAELEKENERLLAENQRLREMNDRLADENLSLRDALAGDTE